MNGRSRGFPSGLAALALAQRIGRKQPAVLDGSGLWRVARLLGLAVGGVGQGLEGRQVHLAAASAPRLRTALAPDDPCPEVLLGGPHVTAAGAARERRLPHFLGAL